MYAKTILFAATALMHFQAWSQATPQELVRTDSGCSVFVNAGAITAPPGATFSAKIVWAGECISGLAEGPGEVRITTRYGSGSAASETQTILRGSFHQGKAFGFSKRTVNLGMPDPPKLESWVFTDGTRLVSFNGLGLAGSDALLQQGSAAMPQRVSGALPVNSFLADGINGSVHLMRSHCALSKDRFPECGFGEGQPSYEVSYFQVRTEAELSLPTASTKIFCPNPRDHSSCIALADQMSRFQVSAIEDFIRVSKPAIKETEMAMRSSLAGRQDAVRAEEGRKAEAAQSAAAMSASDAARFDDRLNKAAVGELFAIGDEYASKGDAGRARQAFRKLLSRFPDHRLAAQAATSLTDLQGK